MNINARTSGAINKTGQSAVESQSGNAAQDTPDLDRNAEAFKHAMGSKPEGYESANPGIVVVDQNPSEPILYSGSGDQVLGSPFSIFPSNGGSGPSNADGVIMAAPASTFQSMLQNLSHDQQIQVTGAMSDFTAANNTATEALNNVGNAPTLDMSKITQPGYVKSYIKDSSAYYDRSSTAISAANNAIDDGTKLMNTMISIDPKLAKTLPDIGEKLMALMKGMGKAPAEIQQVATAFGIS